MDLEKLIAKNKISICSQINLKNKKMEYIHNNEFIPFKINRVFFLFDITKNSKRGNHAHKECHQLLVAINGSFEVLIQDGINKKKFTLNNSNVGLHIPPGIWAEESNFSDGSICLVLASHKYDEKDYFRNYNDYLKWNLF